MAVLEVVVAENNIEVVELGEGFEGGIVAVGLGEVVMSKVATEGTPHAGVVIDEKNSQAVSPAGGHLLSPSAIYNCFTLLFFFVQTKTGPSFPAPHDPVLNLICA